MAVQARPATRADIALIEPRSQDREELWASFHSTPTQAMQYGIERGSACIAFIDDQPAGIFGVVAHGRTGVPWAVFTHVVEAKPLAFLRACRVPVAAMKSNFNYLVNFVDARNEKCLRWLEWMGFTIHAPIPFGVDQLLFHKFDWHV